MTSPYSGSPTTSILASTNPDLNAVLSTGSHWGTSHGGAVSLSYSFPSWEAGNVPVFAGYNGGVYSETFRENTTSPGGLDATQRQAVSEALDAWAAVANLTFREVADTRSDVGDLRFGITGAERDAWGWATYPSAEFPKGGDVWIRRAAALDASWAQGSSNFEGLLHEIGHALGLKHTFEGDVTVSGDKNTELYSQMAYDEAPNSLYFKVSTSASGAKTFRWERVNPDTPMLLDIAAAQYLYGANTSYRSGDDTYSFDPAAPFLRTIWDAGGNDTISVANFSRGCRIDLRAGNFSDIAIPSDSTAGYNWSSPPPVPTYDGTRNLAIAYGATIENAVGGKGADHLIGNAAANRFQGGAGNDSIDGGAGVDTAVYGGPRARFSVLTGTELVVQDGWGGSEGRDVLNGIERLQFSDVSLALDLGGNAGTVAGILGAVFGADAVRDPALVGIGLRFADAGTSGEALVRLALEHSPLGANPTHQALVNLLYTNVVGAAPAAETQAYFTGLLETGRYDQAGLALMAAGSAENASHIGLAGIGAAGLPYVA
jgi:serralysin